jgi:hypothetical protein
MFSDMSGLSLWKYGSVPVHSMWIWKTEWHPYGIFSQYCGFSVIPQMSFVCHRLYMLLRRTLSLNITLSLCISPCLSLTSGTTKMTAISLTECNSGTFQNFPCALNTSIELKHIWTLQPTIPAQLLVETYPARCHYCPM